jgi:hypothetical protein
MPRTQSLTCTYGLGSGPRKTPVFLRKLWVSDQRLAYQGINLFSPFFLLLDSFWLAGVVDGSVVLAVDESVVSAFAGSVDAPSAAGAPPVPSDAGAAVAPFATPSVLEVAAGSVELASFAGAVVVSSLAPLVFVGCAGCGSPGFTVSITAFDPGAPPVPIVDPLLPVSVSVPG